MTSAAGAGGGVGSGSGGGAYFAFTHLFVFGFSLEDSAEAGDEWTHCLFFLVGWGWLGGGEGGGGGGGFFFPPFFHHLLSCWDGSGYAIQMLVPPHPRKVRRVG